MNTGSDDNKLNRLTLGVDSRSPDQHQQATGGNGSGGHHLSGVGRDCSKLNVWTLRMLTSGLVIFVGLIAVTASWFWNGLGQPMDSSQTFWYMFLTKLVFNFAFAYLFYKHFATRRNSSNPWMITRFLVPIGRMSLTVFYVSWLVIWFDLLTSLYQWHPSHYFVCEKFNEIIATTLILSMFVYGSFEGTVKILQYKRRAEKLEQNLKAGLKRADAGAQGFENYFVPSDADGLKELESESFGKLTTSGSEFNRQQQQLGSTVKLSDNGMGGRSQALHSGALTDKRVVGSLETTSSSGYDNRSRSTTIDGNQRNVRHLSIADQYKLNAELRANYSFASIGLYESAGASADLTHPSDPQMSPTPSDRNR